MSEQNKKVMVHPDNVVRHLVSLLGEVSLTKDQAQVMMLGLASLNLVEAISAVDDCVQKDESPLNMMKFLCADTTMRLMVQAVNTGLAEGDPNLEVLQKIITKAANGARKEEAEVSEEDTEPSNKEAEVSKEEAGDKQKNLN